MMKTEKNWRKSMSERENDKMRKLRWKVQSKNKRNNTKRINKKIASCSILVHFRTKNNVAFNGRTNDAKPREKERGREMRGR